MGGAVVLGLIGVLVGLLASVSPAASQSVTAVRTLLTSLASEYERHYPTSEDIPSIPVRTAAQRRSSLFPVFL